MKYSELAPIIVFCYNRPEALLNTLNHLQICSLASQSHLLFYCDGPKNAPDQKIEIVRSIAKTTTGFKSVTVKMRESNRGLATNIIDGVTETISEYGKAIILEDDLAVSPHFLDYMNSALSVYQDETSVASVCGWLPPLPLSKTPNTFFLSRADCLGWATWKRAWKYFESDASLLYHRLKKLPSSLQKKFNQGNKYDYIGLLKLQIDNHVSSWAIRWKASTFLQGMLSLYPRHSLVFHCNSADLATHCQHNLSQNPLTDAPIIVDRIPIRENFQMFELYGDYESKTFRNDLTLMRFIANWGRIFFKKLRVLLHHANAQLKRVPTKNL